MILRINAIPVYGFLSMIEYLRGQGDAPAGKSILDCGAGGRLPPLALFHAHGFDCFGIDISEHHLGPAQDYCQEHGLSIDLRQADMRDIPFADAEFDYVYEHYAMCHLSKVDTARAIAEMQRVLKPGGLCFMGLISRDTWPHSMFGEERQPGEFWGDEEGSGEELTRHSLFSDSEADEMVRGWEVVGSEKRSICLRDRAEEVSPDEWMELRETWNSGYKVSEHSQGVSEDSWRALYPLRAYRFNYTHLYYYLRKPGC